jgi:DNA invertase Pin-like site-specific DNA recombinase
VAVRVGDALVVPKLDRLARSVPDARDIGDAPVAPGVRRSLGGAIYDPADPMSKMFFNMLAVFAEFSVISTRRDGHLNEVRAAA